MTEKKTYTVTADGWCAGKPRTAGDTVQLTERQARYENVSLLVLGVDLASGDDEAVTAEAPTKSKRGRAKK